MKCGPARKLFSAYWDDEVSQAEREWLEAHFGSCPACRAEYEAFSRSIDWVGSLPRVEPPADLLDRVVARTRRATSASDRLPQVGVQWIPVTAAAAVLLIVTMLVSPWVGIGPTVRVNDRAPDEALVVEPQIIEPQRIDPLASSTGDLDNPLDPAGGAGRSMAAIPDSLFDHSEDVEFILDPVTLRRGRATMTHYPAGVQGEHAVITF